MTTNALRHAPAGKRNSLGSLIFTNGSVTWEVTNMGNLLMTDTENNIAVLDLPFEVTGDGAVLVFIDGGETHVVFNGTETVVSR